MKKRVKKFGRGGDIITGIGAAILGKAIYDKYKSKDEEKDIEAVGGPGRRPRTIEEQTGRKAEPKPEAAPAPKEETREDYLAKKVKPIKEIGTFAGSDTSEPNLDHKDKTPPKKTITSPKSAAPVKKAEPKKAAPKKEEPEDTTPRAKATDKVGAGYENIGKTTTPPKKRGGIGPYHAFEGVTDYFSKLREGRKRPGEMKKGGVVKSSASKRADGIAQRGKTKGRIV